MKAFIVIENKRRFNYFIITSKFIFKFSIQIYKSYQLCKYNMIKYNIDKRHNFQKNNKCFETIEIFSSNLLTALKLLSGFSSFPYYTFDFKSTSCKSDLTFPYGDSTITSGFLSSSAF